MYASGMQLADPDSLFYTFLQHPAFWIIACFFILASDRMLRSMGIYPIAAPLSLWQSALFTGVALMLIPATPYYMHFSVGFVVFGVLRLLGWLNKKAPKTNSKH